MFCEHDNGANFLPIDQSTETDQLLKGLSREMDLAVVH
jgi:hypothetical protein